MILTCSFSKQCWDKLDIHWEPFPGRLQAIQDKKIAHPSPFFLEKFIMAAWSIWKERNNKHFRAIPPSFQSWLNRFKRDSELLQHRVKEAKRPLILSFVNTLLQYSKFVLPSLLPQSGCETHHVNTPFYSAHLLSNILTQQEPFLLFLVKKKICEFKKCSLF